MEKLSILAKLELTREEAVLAKQDLKQMISFVNVLKELDTDEIGEEELMCASGNQNVFREDEIRQINNREAILKQAPSAKEHCFVVPCTIGGIGGGEG